MTATVATSLRLGHGLRAVEREHVVELLGRLESRLQSFPADGVELELSVKERATPSQRTTLVAKLGGLPLLVATSTEEEFDAALVEVREDLVRQVTDATMRTEPGHEHRSR